MGEAEAALRYEALETHIDMLERAVRELWGYYSSPLLQRPAPQE